MRYRTKVLLACLGLTASGHAVVALLDHLQLSSALRREAESTAVLVASSIAEGLDGGQVRDAAVGDDPRSRRELDRRLRALEASRRGPGHTVRRIYAVVRDGDRSVILADVRPDGAERPADVMGPPPWALTLDGRACVLFESDRVDADGWITAHAPVRDAEGNAVARVAVEFGSKALVGLGDRVVAVAIGVVLLSVFVAGVLSTLLSSWITRRAQQVTDALGDIEEGRLDGELSLRANDEFAEVANAIDGLRIRLMQRDNLRGALASYVSEEVTESILSNGLTPSLKGERRRITVLFADVRGFTGLSERLSPEQIVGMLNDLMEQMVDVVMRNRGYLNKFLGDGLMAVFGAVRDDADHEVHAVQCALDMQQAMDVLRNRWRQQSDDAQQCDLRIGVGVNTGVAVVGNIGTKQRMDYTAIGDAVNMASRLEATTKEHPGTTVLVGEATYKAARRAFDFVSVGKLQVRGKRRPVAAYTVPLYQRAREDSLPTEESAPVMQDGKPEPRP